MLFCQIKLEGSEGPGRQFELQASNGEPVCISPLFHSSLFIPFFRSCNNCILDYSDY